MHLIMHWLLAVPLPLPRSFQVALGHCLQVVFDAVIAKSSAIEVCHAAIVSKGLQSACPSYRLGRPEDDRVGGRNQITSS